MPLLHRYLGNPVLSCLGRLFFRLPVLATSTAACGASAGTRSDGSTCARTGMEFASEMVVKAALFGLRDRRGPDRRSARTAASRAPHLRTWRDGWRHLRFLLCTARAGCSSIPALLLALGGAGCSPG